MATANDPRGLRRFVSKQLEDHDRALRELKAGRKAGCWSWWVFPTPPFIKNGEHVGSPTNKIYELKDDAEGLAYLAFGELRSNYLAILSVMSASLEAGVEPRRLLGIDVPRAEASVRYFAHLATLGDGDEELAAACQRARALLKPPAKGGAARSLLASSSSARKRAHADGGE